MFANDLLYRQLPQVEGPVQNVPSWRKDLTKNGTTLPYPVQERSGEIYNFVDNFFTFQQTLFIIKFHNGILSLIMVIMVTRG